MTKQQYIRDICQIDGYWLQEVCPSLFKGKMVAVESSEEKKRVASQTPQYGVARDP